MAANIDDIKLKLAVETAGAEGITTLAKDLSALAKEGGDAAPEFQRLSQEFQKIAEQAQLVQAFGAASAKLDDLTAKAASAATQVDKLRIELEQNQAVARQAETAYRTTGDRIDELKGNLRLYATAQASVRVENQTGALTAEQYAKKMGDLRKQIEETTTEIVSLEKQERAELQVKRDAAKAAAESEAAYKKAATSSERLSSAVAKANSSYEKAKVEMNAVGIEAADLATAQQRVASAMDAARAATDRSVSQYEQAAQAVARLADAERKAAADAAFNAESKRKAAEVTYAALFDQIAAQEKAAAAAKEAARQEQAESDRLVAIVAQNRQKMLANAQQQLAAEKQAFSEAAAFEVRQAQERTARIREASEAAAKSLNDAFARTGVRSISAIQAEIAQIQQSMLTLSRSAQVSASDFDRAWAGGQARIKELENELRTIPGHISATAEVTGFLRNQFVQLAAAYSAIDLGRKFIEVNVQIESTRRALTLIAGDTKSAADQIEFLRNTADLTGQSFSEISGSFVRFAASAKGAGIEIATVQDVFKGVTSAAGQLGISSSRTTLMLDALAQMASKGTVSMEELRQQLGDSLPGALGIAARGLGLTEEKLVKLVESGKLTTQEFLPAFSKGLKETFGDADKQVNGVLASWNRLKNAITQTAQSASETGAWKALGDSLDFLATNINGVVTATGILLKSFLALKAVQMVSEWTGIGKAARVAKTDIDAATAATEANTKATVANAAAKRASREADNQQLQFFGKVQDASKQAEKSGGAVVGMFGKVAAGAKSAGGAIAGFFGGPVGILALLLVNARALGEGVADLAARFTGLRAELDANEKKLKELDEQGLKRAKKAQEELAKATFEHQLGLSALNVKYDEMIDKQQKAVVSKGKLVDASKIAAESSVALASTIGNELKMREAEVAATEKVLAAMETQKSYIDQEIASRDEQIKKLNQYVEANGGATARVNSSLVEQIEKLKQVRDERAAEASKIKESTEALKQERMQREYTLESYKDNSARIEELTDALARNREAQEYMSVQLVLGRTTQEAYDNAVRRTALSEGLLNDALKDAAEAADRKISALQRVATQTQASLAIEQARIRTAALYTDTLIEQAKADEAAAIRAGDVTRAVEAGLAVKDLEIRKVRDTIDAKEVEIKVIRAKIEAANAEAKAIIAAAEAEKAQLAATNSLTEAKKAEIEAQIASAKLKQTEAELLAENIKQINEEIDALRAKRRASAEEAYAAAEAKDAEIAKRRENISTIDAETSAIQRKNLMDADGFATDASGKRIEAMGYTPMSVAATLQGYGFDETRARQVASTLFDGNGNLQTGGYSNLIDPRMGEGIDVLLRKIAERELYGNMMARTGNQTQAAPTTNSTPVVVNIAGFKRTVNVASQADATTLVQVLESAFGRSA